MISNRQIKAKVLENESDIKSNYYTGSNFYGFWDIHKKKIVFRIFSGRTEPKTNLLIYFQEVLRFYPEKHKQRIKYFSYSRGNVSELINEKIWVTKDLREPYGMRMYFKTEYNETNELFINLRNKPNGKPYKAFLNTKLSKDEEKRKSRWGFYSERNYKYAKVPYKDITKYITTENQKDKLKEYKIKDLKTEQNIMDLTYKSGLIYLSDLEKYLSLYTRFSGVKIFWKNSLYKQLNEKFLNKLNEKSELTKHYIGLIKTNPQIARKLNTTELELSFKGIDIDKRRAEIAFKSILTKTLKNAWGTIKKGKRKYTFINIDTEEKKYIYGKITENIFKLPIYKSGYLGYYYEADIRHYIDYLELKFHINNKLSPAMIYNKEWRREIDLHKEKIKEEENKKLVERIVEIAKELGIKETELKEGENKNKYLFKVPETLKEYNSHGTKLNHCYGGNINYLKKHVNMTDILIFIEKDGEPFATATLHNDGKITQVHQYQNEIVEKKLETKIKKIIKESFLTKAQEMRREIYGN